MADEIKPEKHDKQHELPRIVSGKKHTLGKRAFFLFLSRHLKWIIIFILLSFAAWYAERWVPADYQLWANYAVGILFIITIAMILITLFETYMRYRYYTYLFTDEAFIVTSGYVVRNEVATLYHHIQTVNIERGVFDRFIGVSKLIIIMTGADQGARRNQIVLPALGRTRARMVQRELLLRSRRQAMTYPEED